jgi:hypothetical protein
MVEFTFFVVARAIRVFTDRAKYGRQHALDFNKGVVRSHAHQDFPCERGENVTKQGLITSVPSSVVGISLLNNRITRLYLDCLDRHLSALMRTSSSCTAQMGGRIWARQSL